RAASLDVLDWVALVAAPGDGGGKLPLQRIDVTADRLALLGGVFPTTRVQAVPAAAGATAVQAEGAALQGALLVPADRSATVSGHFERLHWQSAGADGAATPGAAGRHRGNEGGEGSTAAAGAPAAGDGFDPARIPPLAIDVAQLRMNRAALGSASLRTRPVAGGMRIEQLATRAPGQRIDVSGQWLGRGVAARTQLELGIDSDDF